MRLDKYISNATDLSRNIVKRMIKQGVVTVNGERIKNAAQQISDDDEICIEGSSIAKPKNRYFMMNKPAGVVSATKDRDHETALQLIYEHRSEELQIAGRLDIDTTGLLLITDDGQWNHAITSPKSSCHKTYLLEVDNALDPSLTEKFSTGIWLEGEKRRCLPAQLDIVDDFHARLTISEGKYHQVKRMLVASGNQVIALHREQIGGIVLDDDLELGEYRALTDAEIESVRSRG